MSFHHKAFKFDWESFRSELAPLITQALINEDVASLYHFVESNLSQCSNPYDGQPLDKDWQSSMETGNVQELADFALTKYYEPNEEFGLGGIWQELADSLNQEQQKALLGKPFGPSSRLFDPGQQGSYFQLPSEVSQSLQILSSSGQTDIKTFLLHLASVASSGKGLYVTF